MFFATSILQAFTENDTIYIPENHIKELKPGYSTVSLRGYGFVQAVFNVNNECVGWICKDEVETFSKSEVISIKICVMKA